ncbi:hypothetical protein RKD18_004908 [Streptomyces phaeoluteigriseus]
MYCSRPSVDSGTRIAAAPKQTSGSAVTMPVEARRAECPRPSPVKVEPPCADSHSR